MSARRLPFYFLVDTSARSADANPEMCRNLIGLIIQKMRQDPFHLEMAHMAVIKFGGEAKVVTPLTDVCAFNLGPEAFEVGCGLGYGLSLLVDRLRSEPIASNQGVPGDFRSTVVLWLMSEPTDDFSVGLSVLDSVRTAKRFAFVSGAVSRTTVNRLKDSGFSVVSEESSHKDVVGWIEDIVRLDFPDYPLEPEASGPSA